MHSLWDTIYYNRGRGASNGNNYWKKYAVPHYILCGAVCLLLGIGIGLASLFVCSAYRDNLGWEMFLSYLRSPLILLLNLVPPVLLVGAFYFAFGRLWAGFLAGGGIVTVLSLIDYYKIRLRTEPFTASDIAIAGEAAGILGRYRIEITGRAVFIACALALGVFAAAFLARGRLKKWWVRLLGAILCLAILVTLFFTVYISEGVYSAATNASASYDQWAELDRFVSKGFVYPFLNSAKIFAAGSLQGYSEAAAKAELDRFADETIPEDKKVNIIAVQLEAFTDLGERGVNVRESVYAPLHALQQESLTGRFVANTFGGGTNISERSFVTGYPNIEEFQSYTDSFAWYLRSQGYATEGFHPYDDWFYSRVDINKMLGFERYYFSDSRPETDKSDARLFSRILELWENRDKSRPYFNFSISFQNHGGYNQNESPAEPMLERGSMSDSSYNILNNYLTGVADTTQRMYDFCHYFDKESAPVVVVFYGDHMPWMGDGNSVISELGINVDLGTEEGFFNYYSTPYIVWANAAAKRVSSGTFKGNGGDMSACFLMGRVFEEIGVSGSAYMQLEREVRGTVDIINTTGIWRCGGVFTRSPEGEAREELNRLLYAQKYTKEHFKYGELTE